MKKHVIDHIKPGKKPSKMAQKTDLFTLKEMAMDRGVPNVMPVLIHCL